MADAQTSYIITRQAKAIEERQGASPGSALRQAPGQTASVLLFACGCCARGLDMGACQTRWPPQPTDVNADCQADPASLI